MRKFDRSTVMRSVCFAECWPLLQTPGRSSARQFSIKSPRPTESIHGIKLRLSATPGTARLPDSSKLLTSGSGSLRPTRSTFEGVGKDGKPVKVSYVRTDLSTQTDAVKNEVDPSFINDNYWALFPFHAYWDKSASAIDQGKFNLPVGPGMAELLPIKYPADGGYTPGDTWDLYVGKDNRVVYFVYHPRRGQAAEPRPRNVGRLQKGRSNSVLNRASRHRRWQAPAHLYF